MINHSKVRKVNTHRMCQSTISVYTYQPSTNQQRLIRLDHSSQRCPLSRKAAGPSHSLPRWPFSAVCMTFYVTLWVLLKLAFYYFLRTIKHFIEWCFHIFVFTLLTEPLFIVLNMFAAVSTDLCWQTFHILWVLEWVLVRLRIASWFGLNFEFWSHRGLKPWPPVQKSCFFFLFKTPTLCLP